jgi:hypothetical protein
VGIQPGKYKLQLTADLGLLGKTKAEQDVVIP